MSLARLAPGRSLLEPALRTARALDRLSRPAPRRASRAARSTGSNGRSRAQLRPLQAARPRPRPTKPARPAFARSPRCSPTPAACCRARRCSARSASSSQDDRRALYRLGVRLGPLDVFMPALLKPAAQHWRAALLAVRRASRCRRCRRRAPRRSAPTPTRAAPRSPIAGSADHGSGSTSPTGLPAMPARRARCRGSDPLDAQLATSLGLDDDSDRAADGRNRLRPVGRRWKLARPPRRRANGRARAARAMPSPRWPSSSGADAGADRPLPPLHPPGQEPHASPRRWSTPATSASTAGASPSRARRCASAASSPCRCATRCACCACSRCPSRRGPASRGARLL